MTDYSFEKKQEEGFFVKNKALSLAVIMACMIFIGVFFAEKSKTVINAIPMIRGEVSLSGGFSITTIKGKYPILIKKDDPIVGSKLRFSGDARSDFAETAISLAQEDEIVVEAGSHFGYNAISIAKKLKKPSKYYAFEPNEGIFSCLRKSVILNDLDDVVILKNVAISDSERAFSIDDFLSIIKIPQGHYTKPRKIIVSGSTIDRELFEEPRPVSLLLIDVPGVEFSILRGAERIIENSRDIRILVSFDKTASSKNCAVEEEFQKLKSRGFNFYLVDDENISERKQVDVSDILSKDEALIIMTRNELKI
jgi:FkbM family methyltransferase